MKRLFGFILWFAICLALGAGMIACGAQKQALPVLYENPDAPVLGTPTPTKYGRFTAYPDYISVSLAEAFANADLVAEIVITDWLGENYGSDEEGVFHNISYFRGHISKIYKNTVDYSATSLILGQSGSSQWTDEYYPLYQVGDRLFLCLYAEPDSTNETIFRVYGGFQTQFTVFTHNDKDYLIRTNVLGDLDGIESSVGNSSRMTLAQYAWGWDEETVESVQRKESELKAQDNDHDELFLVYDIYDVLTYLYPLAEK